MCDLDLRLSSAQTAYLLSVRFVNSITISRILNLYIKLINFNLKINSLKMTIY